MSIQRFCENLDIKELMKLPQETQNLFLKTSEILLSKFYRSVKSWWRTSEKYGFVGLAYIIKNMLAPPISQTWNSIYGVREISIVTSKKYGLKVVLLADSHTLEYVCNNKNSEGSANDFIVEQIKSAQCFMDVYLEIPYIYDKNLHRRRIGRSYMANLHDDIDDCFKWDKIRCEYPHLRAHYIDLRTEDLAKEYQKYFQFEKTFNKLHYGMGNAKTEYTYWKNNKEMKEIFLSKATIVANMKEIIKSTKIQKQIDNVMDPVIRKKINEISTKWIENPKDFNIDWEYLTWDYMLDALKTNNSYHITNIYYSFSSYDGVIMDIYTLGRMFREYTYVPNQNSSLAKNMIIYAGGFHTQRYEDFLLNYLDCKREINNRSYRINCSDITNVKQPIFSNVQGVKQDNKKGGKHGDKDCPPCTSTQICNPKSGRCVSKTGNIGKKLLGN